MEVVMAKQRICTEMGTIRAGDVFLVDRWNGTRGEGWRIKCGSFQGLFLEDHEVELVPEILQQKLQLEQIKQDREVLLRQVEELSSERKELLDTIERLTAERKVMLPQKVAEALEQAKAWAEGDIEVVAWRIPKENTGYWKVLFDYGAKKKGGFLELVDALRHGYTIEESLDELERKVSNMLQEWVEAEYEGDEETDRRKFAKRLVSFMRSELEAQSG